MLRNPSPASIAIYVVACTAFYASPVSAQQALSGFRTPSNNIHCLIEEWKSDDGKPKSQLRCDMGQVTGQIPPKPANCEFDWGQTFAIPGDGLFGQRLCYSDTVMNPGYRVLPYGASWRHGGYT